MSQRTKLNSLPQSEKENLTIFKTAVCSQPQLSMKTKSFWLREIHAVLCWVFCLLRELDSPKTEHILPLRSMNFHFDPDYTSPSQVSSVVLVWPQCLTSVREGTYTRISNDIYWAITFSYSFMGFTCKLSTCVGFLSVIHLCYCNKVETKKSDSLQQFEREKPDFERDVFNALAVLIILEVVSNTQWVTTGCFEYLKQRTGVSFI